LAALVVVLTLPAAAGLSARQFQLTPARVHLFAEEASVVRGLLRLMNSLTYDAAALRPSRRAIAGPIRAQNQLLIGLCSVIISDDTRISRAERALRQAHAAQGHRHRFTAEELFVIIAEATEQVKMKMEALKRKGPDIGVADFFEMQMLSNHLTQLSELSKGVVAYRAKGARGVAMGGAGWPRR
jgi:hypothetical protein